MTRINDRLVVQRVDDFIVILDEAADTEVTFPVDVVHHVVSTLTYLAGEWWDDTDDGRNQEDLRTSQ